MKLIQELSQNANSPADTTVVVSEADNAVYAPTLRSEIVDNKDGIEDKVADVSILRSDTDDDSRDIEWLTIDDLPTELRTHTRRLCRVVFPLLTQTPMNDISVIANLGNHGPSKPRELRDASKQAFRKMIKTRDVSMTIEDIIPNYDLDAKLYVCSDDTYLTIKDDLGRCIYKWNSADTKTSFVNSIVDETE